MKLKAMFLTTAALWTTTITFTAPLTLDLQYSSNSLWNPLNNWQKQPLTVNDDESLREIISDITEVALQNYPTNKVAEIWVNTAKKGSLNAVSVTNIIHNKNIKPTTPLKDTIVDDTNFIVVLT